MFPQLLERNFIDRRKELITLPEVFFRRNDQNMRFMYQYEGVDGIENKQIVFESRDMAAGFLRKQGLIDRIVYRQNGSPTMYRQSFEIGFDHKNLFFQKPVYAEFLWEEIEFSPTQVLEYCARAEYEGLGGLMGHCEALIIPFTTFLAA